MLPQLMYYNSEFGTYLVQEHNKTIKYVIVYDQKIQLQAFKRKNEYKYLLNKYILKHCLIIILIIIKIYKPYMLVYYLYNSNYIKFKLW